MKQTRRMSIEIEHRTLIVSVTGRKSNEFSFHADDETDSPGNVSAAPVPPVCPDCGGPWIAVASVALQQGTAAGSDLIRRALQQRGLHAYVSLNELRICSKSFEEVRGSL